MHRGNRSLSASSDNLWSRHLFFEGMLGLGDNFYQRAVIRELPGRHQLVTSWPQLNADLPVDCVKPQTTLRTQVKNIGRRDIRWSEPPRAVAQRVHYVGREGTMLEGLCQAFGVKARRVTFDGPPVAKLDREPYIVVRPGTVRAEWRADSRNPLPEYIDRACRTLGHRFRIVSIADLADGVEWLAGAAPYAHERYHSGELTIEQLLGLVAGASGVIGGVGWLVPAAVAYRVPMLLIYGGWGFHNGPVRIFDPRMDVSRIQQAVPDRFCMCTSPSHGCDKRISRIDDHIERFALRLAAAE